MGFDNGGGYFKADDILVSAFKRPVHSEVCLRVELFDGERVGVLVLAAGLQGTRRRRAVLGVRDVLARRGVVDPYERQNDTGDVGGHLVA